MKRTMVLGLVSLTMLLTDVNLAAQASHETPGARILHADGASEVLLTRVAIARYSRGRTRLEVTVTPDSAGEMFHYYVVADMKRGTYRGFRVVDDPFENPRVRAYLLERRRDLERAGQWERFEALLRSDTSSRTRGNSTKDKLDAFIASEEPPPNCTQCTSTCNGSGFSRAITWDPAAIQLTHTDLTLRWSRDDSPTGCRWNASSQNSCWAANPSQLDTHWFVNHCSRTPVDKAEMYASGSAIGGFHNYDFGDPNQRTDVRNDAIVVFNGGPVAHGFSFYAVGEGNGFLDASVAGASSNNCY